MRITGKDRRLLSRRVKDRISPALLAGRPVLALSQYAEQRLIGERVAALGCGLCLQDPDEAALAATLDRLIADTKLSETARAFAKRQAGQDLSAATLRAADAIDALTARAEADRTSANQPTG